MTLDKDQDLRELFHDLQLPDVDLTGKVMEKLYAEQKKKERFFVKYKVSVMVVAGMLLTVSSAFAFSYQTLTNKQGKVVFEEKTLEEANYTSPSLDEQLRALKARDFANKVLKAGTAGVFYVVSNIPDMKTYTLDKPLTFTDVSALRTKMKGQSVKIFDSLPGKHNFEHATVFFTPITDVNPPTPKEQTAIAEKLRKQAEESKQEYAMLPVEMSKDHWRILSTYKKGGSAIQVAMSRTSGKETFLVHKEWGSKREKFVVKGVEMIYTDFGTGHNIQWIYDVPNSTHTIRYHIETGKQINKKDLIKIAESYLD